jgi:NADH-quinone oxidoreductase subunit M
MRIVVPLFPDIVPLAAPYIAIAGVVGIIYGAKLAFAQKDLKRMVAYTSVSHMGFIMVGVFALNEIAFQGVVMQIIAHALSTGALFVIAGMLQERKHTRNIDDFGGLWHQAPKMRRCCVIICTRFTRTSRNGKFCG